jgi:hypothetical protein
MTDEEQKTLVGLHMQGCSAELGGSLKVDGTLRTMEHLSLGGWEGRVMTFRQPEDVTIGQPVLLEIRPHGEHCGCDRIYTAWSG